MKFWDSSSLEPLCVQSPATASLLAILRKDPGMIAWWGSGVECDAVLARLEREGALTRAAAADAFNRLERLKQSWIEVEPRDEIRELARRLLRVHVLRASAALELAAAYLVSERRPATLAVITVDESFGEAAAKEGFVVTQVPGPP